MYLVRWPSTHNPAAAHGNALNSVGAQGNADGVAGRGELVVPMAFPVYINIIGLIRGTRAQHSHQRESRRFAFTVQYRIQHNTNS